MRASRLGSIACLVVGAAALSAARLEARHKDSEPDLLARIQRETNPVRKAKYEIRLGSLKLQQAVTAYDQQRRDQGKALLDDYAAEMSKAWVLLQSSGRDATRKPDGFKQLDIALRENARLLEDLRHRVPYMDRGPLDQTSQEMDRTHNQVLVALFPGMKPRAEAPRQGSKKAIPVPHFFGARVRP